MESVQQHIDNLLNSEIGKVKESNLYRVSSRKKVYMFDDNNNLVKEYPSLMSLGKEFGKEPNKRQVSGFIKYHGYYVSHDPNFIITPTKKKSGKRESVQLIKDGIVMYEFDSQREAAKFLQVNNASLNHAIVGRQKTCKGYVVKKK